MTMPSPQALAINELLRQFRAEAAAAGEPSLEEMRERSKSFGDVFQMAAGNMPEADDAIARIGAYLRPRLGLV
jgi:hypothetical protein